jgi:hypothetical protein
VTPWVLLALIFAVGAGQTLTSPTWQTLQPELVAPEDRTKAIALGASTRTSAARSALPWVARCTRRAAHLRQHERVSLRDQQRLEEIEAMTDPDQPTVVRHWLAPRLDRNALE